MADPKYEWQEEYLLAHELHTVKRGYSVTGTAIVRVAIDGVLYEGEREVRIKVRPRARED